MAELILLTLIAIFIGYALYMTYKPHIDVVVNPKEKIVLLWYNYWEEGYPTCKRTYKKLFTIK